MPSQTVYISPGTPVDVLGYYETPLGCLEITDDGKLTWTDAVSAKTTVLRERTRFSAEVR